MKSIHIISGLITILFYISNSSFSQNTFKYTIKDPSTDEIVYDAIELSDGSYILTCNQVYLSPVINIHLIRLSKTGNQLGSSVINYQGQSSGFFNIIQINPNKFMFAGYTITVNNISNIWIYETDSLFNEIKSKEISLDTCSLFSLNVLSDESGNILCQGILKDPAQMSYAFIYKFSQNLDSLQFKIFMDYSVLFQPSLLRKVDNSGYYFTVPEYEGVWSGYNESILSLDNSLSIIDSTGVPDNIANYPNSKWINNNTFLLTSRKDDISDPNNRGIEVLSLDTNFSLNHESYIGDHDTIEWPGLLRNLDYIDTNNIYIGGTHNFCRYEFCNQISWFSISNMDSLLNLRWERFYGGSADYTLYGLRATKDGGCLLYGSIYDWATQVNERDIYVIKIDQNGLVGVNDKKMNPLVHDAIVFPNPGSDYLIIESGPQISGAQFIMTTIDWRQVISKILNERRMTLETQFLQSGTYVWQIVFNNRIIETGKWIKE